MIKNIKRVGIIFLTIAIVCLMTIGCFFAINGDKSSAKLQKDKEQMTTADDRATTDIGKIYTDIQGTSIEIFAKWDEVRAESYTMNKFVKIVLNADWVLGSCLTLERYQRIIIDLNGHSITRNIPEQVVNGHLFYVCYGATLKIMDSVFEQNSEGVLAKAEELASKLNVDEYATNEDLWATESAKLWQDIATQTGIGYIGGGRQKGNGGAIYVNDANLEIYSGMFCNNVGASGGFVYVDNKRSILNIYNGIFCANAISSSYGAVLNSKSNNTMISGGLFTGNRSLERGGAISIYGFAQISDCVIYNNYQLDMGAVYIGSSTSFDTHILMQNVRIEGNVSKYYAGGVYATGHSNVRMENISFIGNKSLQHSTDSGGGLQIAYHSSVYLYNCIFRDNYSPMGGAGIDFTQKGSDIETESSKFRIGGFLDMSNNLNENGVDADIQIKPNGKIRIETALKINPDNPNQKPIYLIFANKTGLFHSFTSSYSTYNHNGLDPSKYFTCGFDTHKAVVNSFGELMFEQDNKAIYDFMFLQNGYRKNYDGNEKLHGYNDSDITTFVLGKISPMTSIDSFVENLAPYNFANLQLYTNTDDLVYENGNALNGVNSSNGMEFAVGTGWYIKCLVGETEETIYLSVLGDLTGDGKINSADINYLRRVINDITLYTSIVDKPYLQLAMLINNKDGLTSSDANILWNVVLGNESIELFM